MSKSPEQLLREYVRLMSEDGDMGGSYGYGGMQSYTKNLGDFAGVLGLKGIMNVGKTALAQSKIVGQSVKTGLNVVLQTILTTVIPAYGYNYQELFDKEKAEIAKIKDQYRDVYKATDDALGGDAAFLAFMASPALCLGALAVSKGPAAAKTLLSAASMGSSDAIIDTAIEKLNSAGRWMAGEDDKTKKDRARGKAVKSGKAKSPMDFFGESAMNEDDSGGKKMGLKDLVSNKKLVAKALSDSEAQAVQSQAKEIYRSTLKDVYKQAQTALSDAKSLQSLTNHVKKGKDKVQAGLKDLSKSDPSEKQSAEKALLDSARQAIKGLYVKNLNKVADDVVAKGIPEESQFVKDYRAVASKIKSL